MNVLMLKLQRRLPIIFRVALYVTLVYPSPQSLAQVGANKTPTELDTALARVMSGDASNPRDVVLIAKAQALSAVPVLEEQFRSSTNVGTKMSIAAGLVKLHDTDDTYWNYLLEQATLAVDSDIPDAGYSESAGKMTALAPELQIWAEAHNVSVNTAGIYATYEFPIKVAQLATTGDPRGLPLLRRALRSRDYLIVMQAAKGLAHAHDQASVQLIIAAVRRAPRGYDAGIAGALIYFDDPEARSTVEAYVPKAQAAIQREMRNSGRDIYGNK